MTTPDAHPGSLAFEVTQDDGGSPGGHAVTITSVRRDEDGIRIEYEVAPPLTGRLFGPWGEAQDDLGDRCDDRGGAHGIDRERNRTEGVLTIEAPASGASRLVVRIAWDDLDDIWASRAYELRIDLAGSPSEPRTSVRPRRVD
jgi:hypothetical protein